jgi:hypothetical protein
MRNRHLTVVAALASLLAVGPITGCAQGTGTPSAGGSSGVSSSPSPVPGASASAGTPPASASPTVPGQPGGTPEPAGADMTLNGQIETGAEAHCLILRSNGGTYQLMGGDANIVKAGNNVVVTGHLVKGVMSYCMQGKPFEITQAKLA